MTLDRIAWLITNRIKRAHTLIALRQVRDDMADEYANDTEIKTALLTRERELTK